ncbi:hypothetical protein JIX56_10875 [Streptomyces sp. CA-210063]|uniref:hypothetical protein n=1 Tax=Streptomyces sp. CA-210063 TaxID=2801029 RepID=UPI00214B8E71|nr:hypothetical protein [Streptomyces sp. CA-210063]UUU30364.1 hypothetical protein JIX56_10875 [Streptomyces sp. CA-210063]
MVVSGAKSIDELAEWMRAENLKADDIAKPTRTVRHEPERALLTLCVTNNPDPYGT